MSENFLAHRLWLIGVMVGVGVSAKAATSVSPCVSPAEIAADILHSSGWSTLTTKSGSYRVSEVRRDPVLGLSWAMVASCEHPEQPAFAVQTKEGHAEKTSFRKKDDGVPVVRAGEVVRLWTQEENLRIEMAAVSEESGGLGQTIRVRVTEGGSSERQFAGVVRGVGDVEMRR
jgi:hypothetical protein